MDIISVKLGYIIILGSIFGINSLVKVTLPVDNGK